jgi:hypothetical protein
MFWHFYGKTKTAITSSTNQFRPQFWAQIVAGVETPPYSPFLGPGDHFWQSYEENQVQKIFCRDLPYDFEKSEIDISTFVPGFPILPNVSIQKWTCCIYHGSTFGLINCTKIWVTHTVSGMGGSEIKITSKDIVLYAWAPLLNWKIYIVKSAGA